MRIVSGNVTRAARLAGRNRTEFYKLLDKHGLFPDMFKTPA
jgi:two-component system response regulator GlrR